MGLWVRAHATVKNMGSMGDSDAEKGGLLSLTYASPPEWDCPPGCLQVWVSQSIVLQLLGLWHKDNVFGVPNAQVPSQSIAL